MKVYSRLSVVKEVTSTAQWNRSRNQEIIVLVTCVDEVPSRIATLMSFERAININRPPNVHGRTSLVSSGVVGVAGAIFGSLQVP